MGCLTRLENDQHRAHHNHELSPQNVDKRMEKNWENQNNLARAGTYR